MRGEKLVKRIYRDLANAKKKGAEPPKYIYLTLDQLISIHELADYTYAYEPYEHRTLCGLIINVIDEYEESVYYSYEKVVTV